jgi:hypothetical protein
MNFVERVKKQVNNSQILPLFAFGVSDLAFLACVGAAGYAEASEEMSSLFNTLSISTKYLSSVID